MQEESGRCRATTSRPDDAAACWSSLAAGFDAHPPEFLAPRNLSMLMIELAVTAVLAVGMLMVILPGRIDLSAGSGVG